MQLLSRACGRPVLAVLPVLATLLAAPPAGAQGLDPFAPAQRWSHRATTAVAWLPESLAFADGGNLLWSGASGTHPRVQLFAADELPQAPSSTGTAQPLRQDAGYVTAFGALRVAAGTDPSRLFSLAQLPSPDLLRRRTRISAHDPLAAIPPGGPFTPLWTADLGLIGNGASLLEASTDGSLVVVAGHDVGSGRLRLEWRAGADGSLLRARELVSLGLRGLALSGDGSRLAVVAGLELWVLDAQGSILHNEALGHGTTALDMTSDGTRLAVGAGPNLRILEETAGTWSESARIQGPADEHVLRVALDEDGTTLALGWWNVVTGVSARFQLWSGGGTNLRYERFLVGAPGGFQHYPAALALTPDGRRAAFAGWGDGGPGPELELVDRDLGLALFSEDLPGSALSVALDATGTRVAVGFKHGHANQFASTGEVSSFDTGERDLQVLGAPRPGGTLHLRALLPGAKRVLFLVGSLAPAPTPFGGGHLWVERGSRPRSWSRSAAGGIADLQVPVRAWMLGRELAGQALSRGGGSWRLARTVVRPRIL